MIPLGDTLQIRSRPIINWTIISLNIFIYLWDRQWSLTGPSVRFADLGMRPDEILSSLSGHADKANLITVYTSIFLHGSLFHLFGNMIVLMALGGQVEAALGSIRYAIFYLLWGFAAGFAHILINASSSIPALGASGAIAGMMGCYLVLFPFSKVIIIIPPLFFFPFIVSAWVVLGFWFLLQILFPETGVANWAHVGGFVAGILSIWLSGGPHAILHKMRNKMAPFMNNYD